MPEAPGTSPSVHRVAVVAVHGVGKTEPGSTARHIADLLLGLGRLKLTSCKDPGRAVPSPEPWTDGGGVPYSATTATEVQIPLRRTPVNSDTGGEADIDPKARIVGEGNALPQLLHYWDEHRGYLAEVFSRRRTPDDVKRDITDRHFLAHEFMRSQLAGYVAEEDGKAFTTTRIEVERAATNPEEKRRTVHIFDMRWSDLARSESSIVSFLLAFYQLLFHLGSLSRTAVDHATVEHTDSTSWRQLSLWQSLAVRILVIPIPVLNLLIFLAAGAVVPLALFPAPRRLAAAVILGVLIFGALLLFVPRFRVPGKRSLWVLLIWSLPLALAAVGFAALGSNRDDIADLALAFEWWLVGGLALAFVLQAYEDVRRGAFRTGIALLGLAFVAFLYCWCRASGEHRLEQASLWTLELVVGGCILCWLALLSCALLVNLLGTWCTWSLAGDDATKARARAAVRTGRLTLALGTAAFLLTTIFLWTGLFANANRSLHLYANSHVTPPPITHHLHLDQAFSVLVPTIKEIENWTQRFPQQGTGSAANDRTEFEVFAGGLLLIGVTAGFPLMLLLFVAAFALPLAAVVPTLLGATKKLHCYSNRSTRRLGDWYSRGLDSFRVVTSFGWHAIFTVAFLFGLFDLIYCHGWQNVWPIPACITSTLDLAMSYLTGLTLHILDWAAAFMVASGTALTALIYRYGLVPLDILLDVDTYLRTSPMHNAPRARIAERYVSLLRHICQRQDADGTPYYHSVVIAAHSLGALISADLLCYLKRERDPELKRIGFGKAMAATMPVRLLTFGNPLRQLLSRFFPHLYWWVREAPDGGSTETPSASDTLPKEIEDRASPDANDLGLTQWINAYRSGDFVGRSLWLDTWMQRTTSEGLALRPDRIRDAAEQREEACIGYGAHNDYWNRSAPDIANLLDDLIRA